MKVLMLFLDPTTWRSHNLLGILHPLSQLEMGTHDRESPNESPTIEMKLSRDDICQNLFLKQVKK